MKVLKVKHSYKTPFSMPTTLFSKASLVAEVDTTFKCIKSFAKGTSYGKDFLWEHILDALYGEISALARDLLCVITLFVNLLLIVRCHMSLAEFVHFASLVPLSNSYGRIQPIAMGSIYMWLLSNVVMKKVSKYVTRYLDDF